MAKSTPTGLGGMSERQRKAFELFNEIQDILKRDGVCDDNSDEEGHSDGETVEDVLDRADEVRTTRTEPAARRAMGQIQSHVRPPSRDRSSIVATNSAEASSSTSTQQSSESSNGPSTSPGQHPPRSTAQ